MSAHTTSVRSESMLTDKQLERLRKKLIQEKNELKGTVETEENEITSRISLRDSVDELSTVDNHPADLATELHEREKDIAFEVHNEERLVGVNAALERIDSGTYGLCEKCGEEIPYDRLSAIPHTQFCIEHSEPKAVPTDRPIEETIILPPVDNSFSNREADDSLQDDEDSFRLVAQYGTSDTPADFEGDFDTYNDLYGDDTDAPFEELEGLHVSEVDYLGGQISKAYAEEARETDYLEE